MAMRLYWLSLPAILATAILTWLAQDVHLPRSIPAAFDLLTLSAHDIGQLLDNGTFTSVQLTQEYLRRIELDDNSGLQLHTMLELTPPDVVLRIASDLDLERRNGLTRGQLHGVPIILKGNMATDRSLGLKTTSGAYALRNATAHRDAFIVEKARQAGLVILGKANLGELNGFKDNSLSPGWSFLGGETVSPYDLQHPCGSSGGPASAVAAGFAPLAIGTETQGSISCPASFTALYGLKTSTGVLSRSGILPSSTTFDSPGVLAKSAWDIAALLTVINGADPDDPITNESEPPMNFSASLDANWKDFRIGIADREWFWSIPPFFGANQADIDDEKKMFSLGLEAVAAMGQKGATIIPDARIRSAPLSYEYVPNLMGKIIRHEMGPGFGKHVALLEGAEVGTFEQIVEFNQKHPELADSIHNNTSQGYLESALNQHLSDEDYEVALQEAETLGVNEGIIEALNSYDLDALVLPAWTMMSIYAAWAKAPTATVPLGKYRNGKPYGLGFVARRFDDHKLLQIMKLYEDSFPPRLQPIKMCWRRWEWVLPRRLLGASSLSLGCSRSMWEPVHVLYKWMAKTFSSLIID